MSDNEAHNLLVRVWNSKWVELPPPLKEHIEAYLNRQTRTHDQGADGLMNCDHDWLPDKKAPFIGICQRVGCPALSIDDHVYVPAALAAPSAGAPDASQPA